ncbi:MAG: DUF1566 domain-containing protein [Betaproteobacteria bacterium]|nr:DUF1566 domain-containing protein [Betaproteobacteria bacterium]
MGDPQTRNPVREAFMSLCTLYRLILGALMLFPLTVLAAQICSPGNNLTTPNSDFAGDAAAAVYHTRTGLTWKRCSEGQSGSGCAVGAAEKLNWTHALAAATVANVENIDGYDDWRLPNIKELQTIIETGCSFPAINESKFPGTATGTLGGAVDYWTSTTVAADQSSAWAVNFDIGVSRPHTKSDADLGVVRLVRGGFGLGTFDILRSGGCTLDIDGNGVQDALTDGLILIRALFGLTGTAVTNGAIGAGTPTRATWNQIRPYLNGSCGANLMP